MWKQFTNFISGKRPSSETAKGRLHLVLAHDRVGLDGGRLQQMREEIAEVIGRYVPIDAASVEIQIEGADRTGSKLSVTSPLTGREATS